MSNDPYSQESWRKIGEANNKTTGEQIKEAAERQKERARERESD